MVKLTFLFLDVVNYLFNGFALLMLWGWFIAPILSVPNLSIGSAIGIIILSNLLTNHTVLDSKKEEVVDLISAMASTSFVRAAMSLATGFVVHLFM